jgi:hypothetical protein
MERKFETPAEHVETLKAMGIKTSKPSLDRWMRQPVKPLGHYKIKGKRYLTLDITLPWLESQRVERNTEPKRRGRPRRA